MKHHVRFCFAIACFFVLLQSAANSAEVGLNFTAQITRVGEDNPSYGVQIPLGSILSGHFVYESSASANAPTPAGCSDCASYQQKHINGLDVQFNGISMQADEYIIQVKNDHNVSTVGIADVLIFWYPNQSHGPSPDLERPLRIDGDPVTAGLFRIELVASPTAFTSSQLPATLDPADFILSAGTGFFGDGVPLAPAGDIFFVPESLIAFPHSTSDHDLDGDVDGRDFLIWQRFAGTIAVDGDTNSDQIIDNVDLELWQAVYGLPLENLTAMAIPEPCCFALLATASMIFLRIR